MSDTAVAAIIAPLVAGAVTLVSKFWPPRKPRLSREEHVDAKFMRLLETVEEELAQCRAESRTTQWRLAMLIRAMQEAGMAVPAAAMMEVKYDPKTNLYEVIDSGSGDLPAR